jgi:hypothetical protein
MRKILRRIDEQGPPAKEAARRLHAEEGITVLDEKPSTLLVEGDAETIDSVVETIDGWRAFNFSKVQVPDARPRVMRGLKKK